MQKTNENAEILLDEAKTKATEWTLELLRSLEWKRLEEVCLKYLLILAEDAKPSQSNEINIKIDKRNGNLCLVQCKAWPQEITEKEVRELYEIMSRQKAEEGLYITASSFTKEAITFCQDKNITLLNGATLIWKFKKLRPNQQNQLLNFALDGDCLTSGKL